MPDAMKGYTLIRFLTTNKGMGPRRCLTIMKMIRMTHTTPVDCAAAVACAAADK